MQRLCLLCLLTALAGAQSSPGSGPVANTAGAFFALSVGDIKASARWYTEKFGLKVVMQAPKRDGAAAVALEGGGLIVELVERDDAMPLSKASPGRKDAMQIHGIAKAGAIVHDFDGTVAKLKQRGVEIAFGPFPARGNQRANVIVKDNSGNLIQFFGSIP